MSALYTTQRARKAVVHTLLLRPPGQIGGVISYVLLVRLLSEGEYGIYSLLYAFLPVLSAVASFGLEHTLHRYQPEYLRRGENRLADKLVRRISLIRLLSTIAVLALIFLLWPQIAPIFKLADYRSMFLLFGIITITHFQCSILAVALSSHLLQKYSMGMQTAFSLGKAAAYGIAGFAWGLGLWTVLVIDLALYLALYAGLKYHYVASTDRTSGETATLGRDERRRLLKYGFFYNFNDAGTLPLRARTDNFFVAGFLDPVAVGAYAFCTQLAQTIYRASPLKMLEPVVRPLFVSMNYQKTPAVAQTYFSLLVTFSLVVMIPVFFFISRYHRELVEVVFGGRFIEYSPLLALVFLFAAANAIDLPVSLVAQLKEKAHVILLSRVFGLYNIAALVVLVPRMGIAGAVLASGSAVLMKNLFVWWFVRDLAVWKDAWPFLLRTCVLWAPFVVLSMAAARWLGGGALLHLGVGIVLWGVFFALYLRYAAFTAGQKELLGSLLPGREARLLRAFGVVH